MRRLLVLTYAFPPDNVAGAVRPGQLFDYLPRHEVQPIVFASREYSTSEKPFVFRVPSGGETSAVARVAKFAHWFMRNLAPYDDRPSWAPYAAAAAARFIDSQTVDAIYSTSPFPASHLAAYWLKTKFGLPWIADFQDPIRDNPFRVRRWIYPYDTLLEYGIFRKADCLIANTDTVAAVWRKRYPQWARKISVLWNSFDPREQIETSSVSGRTHTMLAHVGTLYGGRHPGSLLAKIKRLGLDASVLRVKLVGPIAPGVLASQEELFEEMRQRGVLEFDGRLVSRGEALKEIGSADVLLLLDVNEANASLQLPSKLLDYIRSGKPVLAYTPHNSPVERVLANSGIPYLALDPADASPDDDGKLLALLRGPRRVHRPSRWFEENFSAETLARTFADLLDGQIRENQNGGKA
jgi:glycosyltransferase involved in cell wall biosynthesis